MQIDLFTFVAQIINFIILLILLRAFLYKPVLRAMDKRERKIADRLEEAEDKRQQAEKQAQRYHEQQQQIDEERQQILNKAHEEADQQQQEMLEAAGDEVDKEKASWYRALERQKEEFLQNLCKRASQQVVTITRRILSDLADAQLEHQVVRTFIEHLSHADEQDRIKVALVDSDDVVISSAFPLSDEMRTEIETTLEQQFDGSVNLKYQQKADLIAGIRLHNANYELGWSIDDYMQSLEETIRGELTINTDGNYQKKADEAKVTTA